MMKLPLYQVPKKHINIKKWPPKSNLRPPPPQQNPENPPPPPLQILYVLYFAGKDDTSIKNSGPRNLPPSLTPSLISSEILYVSPLPNISTLAILISPRKSPQIAKNGVPKMNFPELPRPRVSVEILQQPWISRNFPAHPDSGFWGPHFQRFGGNDVDMLGSVDLCGFSLCVFSFPYILLSSKWLHATIFVFGN